MEVNELLKIMHITEKLKDTTRHCYTKDGRHETYIKLPDIKD